MSSVSPPIVDSIRQPHLALVDAAFRTAIERDIEHCRDLVAYLRDRRFRTLDKVIACNEAVRDPDEASLSVEPDDFDLVSRALERVDRDDPIDAAAALPYEIAAAQGFFEGRPGREPRNVA